MSATRMNGFHCPHCQAVHWPNQTCVPTSMSSDPALAAIRALEKLAIDDLTRAVAALTDRVAALECPKQEPASPATPDLVPGGWYAVRLSFWRPGRWTGQVWVVGGEYRTAVAAIGPRLVMPDDAR